jgi:hypothetical protein
MFTNPLTRLLVGVAIAIPIVYLLFIVMSQLILVKEVNLEKGEQRVLTAITPQQQDSEVRTRQRSKPKRIDSAKKPPPPPKVSATKSNINLPTPQIEGAAPTELNLGRMQSLAIDPVAISDRDAQPIRPRCQPIRSVLLSGVSKVRVRCASMWIPAVSPITFRRPARTTSSSVKLKGPSAGLSSRLRSFAARRLNAGTWFTRWNSNSSKPLASLSNF